MKISNYNYLDPDEDVRVCPSCKGTGWQDEFDEIECRVCWGYGEIPVD